MAYTPKKRVTAVEKKNGKRVVNLTKLDVVAEYAAFADCSRDEALSRVDGVFSALRSLLTRIGDMEHVDDTIVTINNFGKFTLRHVPAHEFKCNHNGTTMDIPDKKKVLFTPAKTWMDVFREDK